MPIAWPIVDENGNYIGEEYSLALAARSDARQEAGRRSRSRICPAAECSTTSPRKYGGRVIRTPVGEANVVQAMLTNNAVIGGEGNGGVIDPRIVPGRDSLVGIAYVLQLMAATGKSFQPARRRNSAL